MTTAAIENNTIEFAGTTWTFDKNLSADGVSNPFEGSVFTSMRFRSSSIG